METKAVQSPKGRRCELTYREDTSDLSTIGSTWRLWGGLVDEYGLVGLPDDMTGTAIDIGAHIGSVALALLVDHPRLKVVAVEPLVENCDIIRLNAEHLGVADRLTIHEAGISLSETVPITWNWTETGNDEYWRTNRFIGNVRVGTDGGSETVIMPGITLGSLMPKRGLVPFMKIDCEGCEWVALTDPAIKRIRRIVGEYHGHPGSDGLRDLLDPTHDMSIEPNGACGIFTATVR